MGNCVHRGYDGAIAAAAREFYAARTKADLGRRDSEEQAAETAYSKLGWMIDAERHGWSIGENQP